MGIANVEIRLLKARSKAAEDCLRFVLLKQPAQQHHQLECATWWLPLQLPTQQQVPYFDPTIQPLTGLLRVARLRHANKKLKAIDKKLAELDKIAPVEVASIYKTKDYYKELGHKFKLSARPLPKLVKPEPPAEPEIAQRDRLYGYKFCPIKYIRSAGLALQSLKVKLTE